MGGVINPVLKEKVEEGVSLDLGEFFPASTLRVDSIGVIFSNNNVNYRRVFITS